MPSLIARLRARRALRQQIRSLRLASKRAKKRGLAQTEAARRLVEIIAELKAAGRDGNTRRVQSLEAEAGKLLDGDLASCARATWLESFLGLFWAVMLALAIRAFLVEPFQIPTGSMIPTLQIGDHIFVNKLAYGFRIPMLNWHLAQWAHPERGDIVIFPFPVEGPDKGKDYIKRVVALPGDRVHLKDHVLYLNGEAAQVDVLSRGVPCMDSTPPSVRCEVSIEARAGRSYLTQRIDDASCRTPGGCGGDWPLKSRPPCLGMSPCLYNGAAEDNPNWPDVVVPEGHYLMMGDNRDNSSDGRFWGFVRREDVLGKAMFLWWATDKQRMFEAIH